MTVNNGAITGNTASGPGGPADGGGISNADKGTVLSAANTPVVNNTASGLVPNGGGISNDGVAALGTSPVTGHTPNNCRPPGSVPGCVN